MSTGLIALLDDVAALAKVAAASLDDVAAHAAKAGAKAAGVVIDDAAVTPRYVVGFTADRELPIIRRIAAGSLRNKLFYLLPAALALSALAPWAITPLLMLGGAFLCYEGVEKVYEAIWHRHAHAAGAEAEAPGCSARDLEERKVSAAIKTDLILSAEIMAITLSAVPETSFWMQAAVLAGVGLGITGAVYGGVALIVKADDVGVALASSQSPVSSLFARSPAVASRWDRLLRPLVNGVGRGLVLGMPILLTILGVVGTAAMVWVGGGIILHGLEVYGPPIIAHAAHGASAAAGRALPAIAAITEWVVTAAISGIIGMVVGAVLIALVEHVVKPAVSWAKHVRPRRAPPVS